MSEFKKAILAQDSKLVKDLLWKGADVNERYSDHYNTPLHIAATLPDSKSTREILVLLIDNGACLSAVDEKGYKPLMISMDHNKDTFLGFFLAEEAKQKNGTYEDRQTYALGNVSALKKGLEIIITLDEYEECENVYLAGMKTMYHATGVEHPYEIEQYYPIMWPDEGDNWKMKWRNTFDEDAPRVQKILKGEIK